LERWGYLSITAIDHRDCTIMRSSKGWNHGFADIVGKRIGADELCFPSKVSQVYLSNLFHVKSFTRRVVVSSTTAESINYQSLLSWCQSALQCSLNFIKVGS